MPCKACGQPFGCDHSDPEYQGVVPTSGADISTAQQEHSMNKTVREPGGYFVHKAGSNRRREIPTFDDAEAEAKTIQALNPEHSFIIAREVARVVPNG